MKTEAPKTVSLSEIAVKQLTKDLGRAPTADEIMKALNGAGLLVLVEKWFNNTVAA